jgi:membrane-associated phospholipid phosphatase
VIKPIVPKRDVLVGAVALVVLVVCMTIVRDGTVSAAEADVFDAVNGLPEWLEPPMTAMQYLGVLVVPLVFAAVAAALRRWWLALALALVAPLKLLVEKGVIKSIVERQRPGTTIGEDAILRGDVKAFGSSFPSGHAVIAFAIAWLLFCYLPRSWRWAPIAIGCLVLFARVYLGAHNPLDVVAGAAAGLLIGAVIDAVVRPRERDEHDRRLASTLRETPA